MILLGRLGWDPLADDLAAYHPSIVSIETAANGYLPQVPCMVDESGNPLLEGSPGFFAKYAADLDYFFATVTTTGELVSVDTGAKSRSGSNGMSFTVNGLMATLPTWICASV